MQKEMSKLNQNIVHALSYALNGVESYATWLQDAKDIQRMAYHEAFEELLRDSQKAVAKLRSMVEGHCRMEQW
jgi:hypothetical protein